MARRREDRTGSPADLLVVGLGNPGDEYAQTRHNVGYWVVDELVDRHGGRLRRGRRDNAESDLLRVGGARVAVARPVTYYNEVGRAVSALVKRHGISDYHRLVVVHDELDLPVGRLKLKAGGGLAGNNGLRSVQAHLKSTEFARLRIGIGKPAPGTMAGRDYVLRRPARADRPVLAEVVSDGADALEFMATGELEAAMNRFNR